MRSVFKTLAALVVAGSLACALAALCGCTAGSAQKDAVRDVIATELELMKTGDEDCIAQIAAGLDVALEQYGIEGTELARAYLEGFDYQIGSIDVDGDTATVEVTLTVKSFMDFQNQFLTLIGSQTGTVGTEQEAHELAGDIMMQAMQNAEVRTTQPFTVTCTKADGTWTPDAASEEVIAVAMFSN